MNILIEKTYFIFKPTCIDKITKTERILVRKFYYIL